MFGVGTVGIMSRPVNSLVLRSKSGSRVHMHPPFGGENKHKRDAGGVTTRVPVDEAEDDNCENFYPCGGGGESAFYIPDPDVMRE